MTPAGFPERAFSLVDRERLPQHWTLPLFAQKVGRKQLLLERVGQDREEGGRSSCPKSHSPPAPTSPLSPQQDPGLRGNHWLQGELQEREGDILKPIIRPAFHVKLNKTLMPYFFHCCFFVFVSLLTPISRMLSYYFKPAVLTLEYYLHCPGLQDSKS